VFYGLSFWFRCWPLSNWLRTLVADAKLPLYQCTVQGGSKTGLFGLVVLYMMTQKVVPCIWRELNILSASLQAQTSGGGGRHVPNGLTSVTAVTLLERWNVLLFTWCVAEPCLHWSTCTCVCVCVCDCVLNNASVAMLQVLAVQ